MRATRRTVLLQVLAAGAVALVGCSVERSATQAPKRIPRVGYFAGPSSSPLIKDLVAALKDGMRAYGLRDGENVQIDLRYEESVEDWDTHAREFASIPVDVMIAADLPSRQAALQATKTIPIVVLIYDDPVASGLVPSLAHPGGNLTGIANTLGLASGKALELLRELAPGIRRVGVIWNGAPNQAGQATAKGARDAAPGLGVDVVDLVVGSGANGVPRALQQASDQAVDALLVGGVPFYISDRKADFIAFALERRIPLASNSPDWVEAGGLFAFGTTIAHDLRRVGYFVDKILKGTKPGDIPMETPAQFDTIVNLKTAKALGVTISQSVLARATRVIE